MTEEDLPETSEAGPKGRSWTGEKIGAIAGAIAGTSIAVAALIGALFQNARPGIGEILGVPLLLALIGAFVGAGAGKFISGFCRDVLGYESSIAGPPPSTQAVDQSRAVTGYTCPKCDSSDLIPYGKASPFGTPILQCKGCQLKMLAPSSSKLFLLVVILVEVLAGCGTLALFLFLLAHGIARGKLLVLMLALPILCLIGVLVAIIELCRPVARSQLREEQ